MDAEAERDFYACKLEMVEEEALRARLVPASRLLEVWESQAIFTCLKAPNMA